MSKFKKVPEFKSAAEEGDFWESHDSTDSVDWSQARPASFSKPEALNQNNMASLAGSSA